MTDDHDSGYRLTRIIQDRIQRAIKQLCVCVCVCVFVQDPVGLNLDSDKWQDVNVVISLLKLFFRKLPESLVTTGKCCSHISSD